MAEYKIQAPDGNSYQIAGPENASQEDVQREVLRQHPQAGQQATKAATTEPAGAPQSLIAQVKERLTAEPPEGQRHGIPGVRDFGPDLGAYVRSLGRAVIPGSYPGLISTAASLVPGAGPLWTMGRMAGATAASAGVEAVRGGDPMAGGAEALISTGVGAGLGAAGKATGRYVMSKLGPEAMPNKLGELVGRLVPSFKGKDGPETVQKILSGEAQQGLSAEYRASQSAALQQLPPMTMVSVPALTQLGQKGPVKGMPELFEPADAMTRIDSLSRSLTGVTGSLSRRKGTLIEMSALDKADNEFALALQQALPPGSNAVKALADADTAYARGKAIERFIGSGRESMTPGQAKKFRDSPEIERARSLESSFLDRMGELRKRFTPDEFAEIAKIVRRGEMDPNALSQAGKSPGARWHLGFIPTIHGMPRAPRPIGSREQQAPETIAEALRAFGTRLTGAAIEPTEAAGRPAYATSGTGKQQPLGGPVIPKGAHREGGEIVSDSGKYAWRDGAWQPRK